MDNKIITSLEIANRENQNHERQELKSTKLEVRGNIILTTKQLAEMYGCSPKNIKDNFLNHKDKFDTAKHYFLLEGAELKDFKRKVDNIDLVPNNVNKLYVWTERGALSHAKILDTDLAWDTFDILVNTYFKVQKVNSNPYQRLSKELQAIFMLDGKQQELDGRVTKIENRMTIETGHQKTLNDLVKKKVTAVLGGKDKPAYKELSKKAFRKCWDDYKNKFNVASYKDTPLKDFENGKHFITEWKPDRELELMIKGCNLS